MSKIIKTRITAVQDPDTNQTIFEQELLESADKNDKVLLTWLEIENELKNIGYNNDFISKYTQYVKQNPKISEDDFKKKLFSEYKKTPEFQEEIRQFDGTKLKLENEVKRLTELTYSKDAEKRILEDQKFQIFKQMDELKKNYEEKINSLLQKHEETFALKVKSKEEELKNKSQEEINNYKLEVARLEQELKTIKSQQETELKAKEEILQAQIKSTKAEIEKTKLEEIAEKNEKLNILQKHIDELERNKKVLNIKRVGENLENWVENQVNESFLNNEKYTFEKINISKEGTKADFLFKTFDSEISDKNKNLLTSAVIEVKSETVDAENKKKNKDHIDKLIKDRDKEGAEYGILVSELELDSEDGNFLIKKSGNESNIFIVRPQYLVSLLSLLQNFSYKGRDLKLKDLKFRKKQEILQDFNDLKNGILEVTFKNIQNNFDKIQKQANNIKDNAAAISKDAEIILGSIQVIVETHFETAKNKLNKFTPLKLSRMGLTDELDEEE
ncbi:DUF2130 domain-containing protein [[Mycoplasma] testudinis]|uniref:DUF2130 domain-containing protein n=1 Tax=[Mycoplasma] testudinis TaxID=33924 RepID=UPI000480152D|nr:DUF2130 domain-containing protein [[Mycoplasma] testudinis]